MTDVRLIINGSLKVVTGEASVACIFGNPGVPCDFPMDRHPGSKGS